MTTPRRTALKTVSACQILVAELLACTKRGRSTKLLTKSVKKANWRLNLLSSASSAVAKWVKIPSTSAPSALRPVIKLSASPWLRTPMRPIPESILIWQVKPVKSSPWFLAISNHSSEATVRVMFSWIAKGTLSGKTTPKISIGCSKPAWRSSSASSRLETQKPSTCLDKCLATATAPWP